MPVPPAVHIYLSTSRGPYTGRAPLPEYSLACNPPSLPRCIHLSRTRSPAPFRHRSVPPPLRSNPARPTAHPAAPPERHPRARRSPADRPPPSAGGAGAPSRPSRARLSPECDAVRKHVALEDTPPRGQLPRVEVDQAWGRSRAADGGATGAGGAGPCDLAAMEPEMENGHRGLRPTLSMRSSSEGYELTAAGTNDPNAEMTARAAQRLKHLLRTVKPRPAHWHAMLMARPSNVTISASRDCCMQIEM